MVASLISLRSNARYKGSRTLRLNDDSVPQSTRLNNPINFGKTNVLTLICIIFSDFFPALREGKLQAEGNFLRCQCFVIYLIWQSAEFSRRKDCNFVCRAGNSERTTSSNKFSQFVKILSHFIFCFLFFGVFCVCL